MTRRTLRAALTTGLAALVVLALTGLAATVAAGWVP